MIIFPQNESLFVPHHTLQKLLFDKELIKQLAIQLVAGQVEAHIEMGADGGNEYKTHVEAANMICNAKSTVEEYAADLLSEFRTALYAEIRNVEIEVRSTTFTNIGFDDAVVEVK